jgi:xylan 1,4-beta-xylosidase
VIATRKDHEVEVLVWNYHDDDLPTAAAPIDLMINGLPTEVTRGLLEQFLVDSEHSNAFAAWKEMGSPNPPSAGQHQQLETAGQLQLLNSPAWLSIENRTLHLQFALPRQGLRLLRISW